MQSLTNKRILLGVSGGIAAYKSAELVRRLREQGAEVRVVMTHSAGEFITPLTMQALSGNPVATEWSDQNDGAVMEHIDLGRWADCILVAPASANFMARLTHGMADDLLAALCLAADVPLLLAPAMNRQMWQNPATQENSHLLQARGITLLGPGEGDQACGETGPGRMLEPAQLLQGLTELFNQPILAGTSVMITAGPTQEPIDPVRYLSNHSSGHMGYAVARAAVEAGAEVTLVSGPVALSPPPSLRCVKVQTAREMYDAVMQGIAATDIFIATAAVADYACVDSAHNKIKKTQTRLTLELERNPDILQQVAAAGNAPFTVGFAAETEAVAEHARQKLRQKNLDLIAANQVGTDCGFGDVESALELIWQDGAETLSSASKDKLARQLIQRVARQYHQQRAGGANVLPWKRPAGQH
ncbi:MAG: bifunctional phosphopantothenoylcysteine decarboxylase/phosphopantothenate--cysteine ligase CoaBC [Gammaproteobacteria bacterium]